MTVCVFSILFNEQRKVSLEKCVRPTGYRRRVLVIQADRELVIKVARFQSKRDQPERQSTNERASTPDLGLTG